MEFGQEINMFEICRTFIVLVPLLVAVVGFIGFVFSVFDYLAVERDFHRCLLKQKLRQ